MKTCAAMRRMLWLTFALGTALSVQALAEDPPPTGDEARRSQVFAKVGNTEITVGDLEDIIAARSPYARQRLTNPNPLRNLADAQVQSELFFQGAERLGYATQPPVSRFVDQTMVKVFVRKEFEETVSPDDVPLEDVARYYEEHRDDYRRAEMRRARHIVLGTRQEAESLLEQLRTDESKRFRKIARQSSLDTETRVRGGDLLYFTKDGNVVGVEAKGTVDATLVAAAYELEKTGELAGPLDLGDDKWSVLELTGIRPEQVQTLEQATGAIRRKLWREEREGALEALVTELRTELQPEVYPERMDAVVLPGAAGAKKTKDP